MGELNGFGYWEPEPSPGGVPTASRRCAAIVGNAGRIAQRTPLARANITAIDDLSAACMARRHGRDHPVQAHLPGAARALFTLAGRDPPMSARCHGHTSPPARGFGARSSIGMGTGERGTVRPQRRAVEHGGRHRSGRAWPRSPQTPCLPGGRLCPTLHPALHCVAFLAGERPRRLLPPLAARRDSGGHDPTVRPGVGPPRVRKQRRPRHPTPNPDAGDPVASGEMAARTRRGESLRPPKDTAHTA
jgi:hypothetical protein